MTHRLGRFHLSTIRDDYSRHTIAWKLCTTMRADDVTDTLKLALQASGRDKADIFQIPRLLSDKGSYYIAGDLADWLTDQGMDYVRGAPTHRQTQGKIECWHQTSKNRFLLENYFLPGGLEASIGVLVELCNYRCCHECLSNPTPADVFHGPNKTIIERSRKIKQLTIDQLRLAHTPSCITSIRMSQTLR